MDSQEKILSKIQSEEKQHGSILEQYRQALIEMTRKYFSQKEMAEMLNRGGVKITQQAISKYLNKRPITVAELNGDTPNFNHWKEVKKSKNKKPKRVIFDLDKPF